MVVHKDPGVDDALRLLEDFFETLEKPFFILGITKNICLIDSPDHDVMQCTGDVQQTIRQGKKLGISCAAIWGYSSVILLPYIKRMLFVMVCCKDEK